MLKENWRSIARVQQIGDLCIVCVAFLVAYHGRSLLIYWNNVFSLQIPFRGDELAPLKDYMLVLVTGLLSYALVLSLFGAYRSMRLADLPRLVYQLSMSSLFVFFVLATVVFLVKLDLSRSFIVLFCALSGFFLTGERYVVLAFLRYWRRRGRNFRNIIIFGSGLQSVRLAQEIANRPELGVGIKRFARFGKNRPYAKSIEERKEQEFFEMSRARHPILSQVPIIYGLEAVEAYLEREAVDEIIFTDIAPVMQEVESLVRSCTDQGIRTTIAGDLFSTGITKSDISYFSGMPLIHFQTPPGDRWELSLKRMIDFIGAFFLLVLSLPIFILIAISVKFTSPGPIFFKQERVGLNGRRFNLYKFRSMAEGSERRQSELQEFNEMSGPVFKISNDPRRTPLGVFLRRYSLDELPQLWNVLRADMSLVGPRPPIPTEVSLYERTDRRRLSMRPGLTCLWQVSGRNAVSNFETWVKLDLEYIDNWSLLGDIVLLLKTIPVVMTGNGAH
jgi:exopolysaccharide biosynthesis polyprenyl glycosylphosphotransferase